MERNRGAQNTRVQYTVVVCVCVYVLLIRINSIELVSYWAISWCDWLNKDQEPNVKHKQQRGKYHATKRTTNCNVIHVVVFLRFLPQSIFVLLFYNTSSLHSSLLNFLLALAKLRCAMCVCVELKAMMPSREFFFCNKVSTLTLRPLATRTRLKIPFRPQISVYVCVCLCSMCAYSVLLAPTKSQCISFLRWFRFAHHPWNISVVPESCRSCLPQFYFLISFSSTCENGQKLYLIPNQLRSCSLLTWAPLPCIHSAYLAARLR